MSNATISHEERESLSVGIAYGDVRYAPQIADAVNRWSWDAQEEYGKDSVLTVNGQPIDTLVGAAAVRNAFIKKFGTEPKGIEFRGQLPVTKPFDMQQFKYQMRDEETVLETELESERIWPVARLSEYLDRCAPEFEQPRVIRAEHRPILLQAVKDTLKIVGAPTYRVSVPQGAIEYPPNGSHIKPEDIIMVCSEADGDQYGHPRPVARFIVIAKKQFAEEVDEFYELVLDEVAKVYSNRYLVLGKGGRVSFIDPWTKLRRDELILNSTMMEEFEGRIFGPIRNVERARKIDHRILNRKFLFAGEAGTGKTMSTLLVAMEGLENGWTIVQIQPGTDAEYVESLNFASILTPVIVIAEDLEKMMPDTEGLTTKQRLEARSKLLDLFDGGEVKGKEIIFLFTTNYQDIWISAMARPGRVDGYWVFEPLDREGFEKLARIKLNGMIGDDIDFDALWEDVKGMSSSFLAALADYARDFTLGHEVGYLLTTDDLKACVRVLARQNTWYTALCESEAAGKVQTVPEFYDAMVRPTVVDVLSSAGFTVK